MLQLLYRVSNNFFNDNFIKDLGHLKYFLRLEVARSKAFIVISQQKYTLEIIDVVGYLGAQFSNFPM